MNLGNKLGYTGQVTAKTGVSYFGNQNPAHFRRDLEDIIAHHCSFLVHMYSENDRSYYKGTLQEMIGLTREAGL